MIKSLGLAAASHLMGPASDHLLSCRIVLWGCFEYWRVCESILPLPAAFTAGEQHLKENTKHQAAVGWMTVRSGRLEVSLVGVRVWAGAVCAWASLLCRPCGSSWECDSFDQDSGSAGRNIAFHRCSDRLTNPSSKWNKLLISARNYMCYYISFVCESNAKWCDNTWLVMQFILRGCTAISWVVLSIPHSAQSSVRIGGRRRIFIA